MNKNEKYFVSLISSYLNNKRPIPPNFNIDWNEIYKLSAIHNVSAIVANQIIKIKENQPDENILSKFRQQIGYTLIDATQKEKTINFIRNFLNSKNIDFIFVKGAILRNYYPIKDFRTGSDIDVIIRDEDFKNCENIFNDNKFKVVNEGANGFSVYRNNQHIEFHSVHDYDNPYFADIFDMCVKNSNEYVLKKEYHLLYVLCHIVKHFNNCGAGIKMFMDIDAIIRNIDYFDYEKFIEICREINIETFAKASFALCNYWFSTPIKSEINLEENSDFRELFETEIIKSGNFGFNSRDLGDYYINKGIGQNGKNGIKAKIKALFIMAFPKIDIMRAKYGYLKNRPYLLPVAWISRIFSAAFKRTEHSKGTIKSIINTGKESEQYKKLLNELNI